MLRSNQISDSRAASAATSLASIDRIQANFSPDPERTKELFTIGQTPVPSIRVPSPTRVLSLSTRSKTIRFISRKRILLLTFSVEFLV